MMKASKFIFVPFALGIIGAASIAVAQEPVQLKFSRVVDLTLPIETNMAGIPGFKILRRQSFPSRHHRSHDRGPEGDVAVRRDDAERQC